MAHMQRWTEEEVEELRENLHRLMTDHGFEIVEIKGERIYHSGDKYVRIICDTRMATLELAVGLNDAENNLYEDIDIYNYGFMRLRELNDIFGVMRDDIIQYVFNA